MGGRKYVILLVAYVEVFLYSGIMFGWGELVYVFKQEGIFADRCDTTGNGTGPGFTESSCNEAEDMFNLYFTVITTVGAMLVLPIGHCFSKLGTRVTRVICTLFCCLGCLLLAFADSERHWLICVGGLILMGPGYVYTLTSVQIAKLYPSNAAATVIGSISGMKISSSAVLLIVKIAFVSGISRRNAFLFLAILTVIPMLSTFTLYPKMFFDDETVNEYLELEKSVKSSPKQSTDVLEHIYKPIDSNGKLSKHSEDNNYGTMFNGGGTLACKTPEVESNGTVGESVRGASDNEFPTATLRKSLTTILFVTHVFWMIVMRIRISYFFGEMNHFIETRSNFDVRKVSYNSDVIHYTMSAGLVFCMVVGIVYDLQRRLFKGLTDPNRRRMMSSIAPLTVTCIVGTAVSLLTMSHSLNIIYVLAFMFTSLRALTASIGCTFLADAFPVCMYGSMFGIRHVIVYGISFAQYPLFRWSLAYPGADLHVSLLLVVLSVLSLSHPLWVYRTYNRAALPAK